MNFEPIYERCKDYSMTCKVRMRFLYDSVLYVIHKNIPGDLIETGVWKGGNIMLMGMMLDELGSDRRIWAYDTFEGMPDPTKHDLKHDDTKPDFSRRDNLRAPLEQVSYDVAQATSANIRFVKGKVEDTIPKHSPEKIALLRTDTDFYESTRHTLKHLYPLISKGGFFINDDYHKFLGAKKACDEFLPDFKRIGETNAIWRQV